MDEKVFLVKIVEILDTETEIRMDTDLKSIEEWDSLSLVSFIAFASTSCGKKLKADQVEAALKVSDLYQLIK